MARSNKIDDAYLSDIIGEDNKARVIPQVVSRPTANGGVTTSTSFSLMPTRKPAETYNDTKYNFDVTPTKFKTIINDYYKKPDPNLLSQITNFAKNYDIDLDSDLNRAKNNEYDNLTRNKLYKKYLELGGLMHELGTKTNQQNIIDFATKFNRKAEPLYVQDPKLEQVYSWLESQGASRDSELAAGLTPENIEFIVALMNAKKK